MNKNNNIFSLLKNDDDNKSSHYRGVKDIKFRSLLGLSNNLEYCSSWP